MVAKKRVKLKTPIVLVHADPKYYSTLSPEAQAEIKAEWNRAPKDTPLIHVVCYPHPEEPRQRHIFEAVESTRGTHEPLLKRMLPADAKISFANSSRYIVDVTQINPLVSAREMSLRVIRNLREMGARKAIVKGAMAKACVDAVASNLRMHGIEVTVPGAATIDREPRGPRHIGEFVERVYRPRGAKA